MRTFILLIISIITLSLQISVPNFLGLDILPNIALVLVICYSYIRSDIEGAIFGLMVGLMQDALFPNIIGYYAFIYFIVGYISNHILKAFLNLNVIPVVFLNFIVTFIYGFMIYFLSYFFKGRFEIFNYVYHIMFFEAIENAIVSIPIFYFIYFIDSRLKVREQKTTKYYNSF